MVLTETLFISSSRTSSRLGTYSRAHVDDDRQISSGKRLMEVREELLTESSFGKLSDRDENIYLWNSQHVLVIREWQASKNLLASLPVARKYWITNGNSMHEAKDQGRTSKTFSDVVTDGIIMFHFIYIFTLSPSLSFSLSTFTSESTLLDERKMNSWMSLDLMSRMSNAAVGRMLNVNLHVVSNSIYRLNDFLENDAAERESGRSFKRSLNDANRAHLSQHKGRELRVEQTQQTIFILPYFKH